MGRVKKPEFYYPVEFDPKLKAENVIVTHIPATNPHPEHTSNAPFPIPENHKRTKL